MTGEAMVPDALTGAAYTLPGFFETSIEKVTAVNADAIVWAMQPAKLMAIATMSPGTKMFESSAVEKALSAHVITQAKISEMVKWPKMMDATPFTITLPETPAATDPPAFRAFRDLRRWIDASDEEIADMVGIGRTTPYAWRRQGHEPRPSTTQRLYEYHATLDSLRRRLGSAMVLRRWLYEGAPATRREALLSGHLEALERDVHDLLFRRDPGDRVDLAAAPEEPGAEPAATAGAAPRPSGRRPRRLPR